MKNLYKRGLALVGSAAVALPSFAAETGTGVDYAPLTNSFSAANITVAIMAVAGTLAVIYAATKGAKIVLGMLRG